jgi:hypothetical protein
MNKFRKRITNPMTLIATFATLSETSAAISLPFLDESEREIYVWFLISFPFYLLFLFFATLNFNYRSLYSPSDFQKDEHFLKAMDEINPKENNAAVKPLRSGASRSAQAPPEDGCPQPAHQAPQHIRLPALLKDMHIIDVRWMETRLEFSALLDKVKKTQQGKSDLIVLLTNTALEKSLRASVRKFSRQRSKHGSVSCCVAYDLSSQRVTVH